MMKTLSLPPTSRRITTAAVVAAVIWATALSAVAQENDDETTADNFWIERTAAAPLVDGPESPYPRLVEAVGPAVVSILVSYDSSGPPPRRGIPFRSPSPERLAEGSGFIINPDGYIVTNYHVIDHASALTVRLPDNREYDAEVIGGDPMTDLALLKVEADEPLPTVSLGDSNEIHAGDYVVAIGNPLGLSHSVTAGIISAVDRRDLPIQGREHQGNFIQVDAPINPGNSGGPLIDMNGEVIGINTAVNQQGQGISFAIPVNLLKTLLPQLKERGWVDRSWLGVRIQPLDRLLAQSFDLDDTRGALVTEVVDDSPASRADIRQQDIIVAVDGQSLMNSDALPLRISTTPGGSTISLEVIRDGEQLELEVELESLPDQERPDLPTAPQAPAPGDVPAGVEVEAMTDDHSRRLDAPADRGVVITSLSEDSPARQAGVRNNDIILEVGSTPVDSEEQFHRALEEYDNGTAIRLKLLRDGRTVYKAFTN